MVLFPGGFQDAPVRDPGYNDAPAPSILVERHSMTRHAWALGVSLILLLSTSARAQIRWINDLEQGLTEARDRDAPILAFFWDYN